MFHHSSKANIENQISPSKIVSFSVRILDFIELRTGDNNIVALNRPPMVRKRIFVMEAILKSALSLETLGSTSTPEQGNDPRQ